MSDVHNYFNDKSEKILSLNKNTPWYIKQCQNYFISFKYYLYMKIQKSHFEILQKRDIYNQDI